MRLLFTLFHFCLVISVSACKKLDKKNPIEFKIKAHIPYNDEPISGVKYTIREYRSKKELILSDIEYTDFKLEGYTNANGEAVISFPPKKNMNYRYDITFDYSQMQFANYSESYSLIRPPTYFPLSRKDQKDFEIRALPLMQVQWNFKNLSCFDANDTFKYKQYNLDELPNYSFNNGDPWQEGPTLNGCVDITGNYLQRLAGRYVFKWEATRGGILTTGIDTFFVSPGGTDYINMYW
ncbi:hypothetical protein [Fluviicola chungangensis]|uniref:Uncharacterized protein n=1 Tax=Fluviicola chungangensis TaxID=2597671 RepID=A0A556N2J2_9FLAO|nr:hypothetical protein [Fluviicola chungangensis]TSJ46426.1 hypothetical protein FO442_04515 [Fluviicola chungangensis]